MNEPLVLTDELLRRALERRMAHAPSPMLLDRVIATARATPQLAGRRLGHVGQRTRTGLLERRAPWALVPSFAGAAAVLAIALAAVLVFRAVVIGPGATPSPRTTPSPITSTGSSGDLDPTPQPVTLGTHAALRLRLGNGFEAIDPIAVAFADGSIWTAQIHGNDVRRFDPDAFTAVATIPIPSPGGGPAWFAATPGAIWVSNQLGDGVTRIDTATNRVVAQLGAGGTCGAPVVAFAAVWQSICDSDTILRIDPATNAVETIAARGHTFLVLAGDRFVAIAATGLATFDPTSRRFQPLSTSFGRVDLLLGWDGSTVWARGDAGLLRIDPVDGHTVAAFDYQEVQATAFANGHAWLTLANVGQGAALVEIDLSTNEEVQRIPITGSPLVPVEANGLLWVTDFDNSSLWRIEP